MFIDYEQSKMNMTRELEKKKKVGIFAAPSSKCLQPGSVELQTIQYWEQVSEYYCLVCFQSSSWVPGGKSHGV